jgi:hypothetical protein
LTLIFVSFGQSRTQTNQNKSQKVHSPHQTGLEFGFPVPATKATRRTLRHAQFLLLEDMDQEDRDNDVFIHPTEISIERVKCYQIKTIQNPITGSRRQALFLQITMSVRQ